MSYIKNIACKIIKKHIENINLFAAKYAVIKEFIRRIFSTNSIK
jgi:hypothetical protein